MKKVDYLTKAITKSLKPVMEKKGFYRIKPKVFVRVMGDIVSVVAFQLSRWGSGIIYMHCFCNLLLNEDFENTIEAYSVGNRFDENNNDKIMWISTSEEDTQNTMSSIIDLLDRDIFDWFDSIQTIEDYIVEYMDNKLDDIWKYDRSVEYYFSLIGKDYLGSYLKTENKIDYIQGNIEKLYKLIKMTKTIDINQEYLNSLRSKNIEVNKLEKALVTDYKPEMKLKKTIKKEVVKIDKTKFIDNTHIFSFLKKECGLTPIAIKNNEELLDYKSLAIFLMYHYSKENIKSIQKIFDMDESSINAILNHQDYTKHQKTIDLFIKKKLI